MTHTMIAGFMIYGVLVGAIVGIIMNGPEEMLSGALVGGGISLAVGGIFGIVMLMVLS